MDEPTMLRRLEKARVARLATADAAGTPHLVPITFALDGEVIYFAVDAKPKRTTDLKRLRNIDANPRVSLLVDHYADDWNALWWVRADGIARVMEASEASPRAMELLADKYPQYRAAPPPGPVVVISIVRMTGWEAAANPAC